MGCCMVQPEHLGTVIKLYPPYRPGSKTKTGLVRLDKTGEVIPFSGTVDLTERDLAKKTKIFGMLKKGRNRDEHALINIKRW